MLQQLRYVLLAASDLALDCRRKAAGFATGLAKMQTCCRDTGADVRAADIAAEVDTEETVAQAIVTG